MKKFSTTPWLNGELESRVDTHFSVSLPKASHDISSLLFANVIFGQEQSSGKFVHKMCVTMFN